MIRPENDDRIGDIITVATFIVHHHDDEMSGGVTASEAFKALCNICGISQLDKLKAALFR